MNDDRTSLPMSGAAVLVAALAPTFDKHAPQPPMFPILIDRMIREIQDNPNKLPVDDDAIETLLLVQRYLHLVENALKSE